jgi:biopolymer transport protein ExbD
MDTAASPSGHDPDVMVDINTTPLIDVMLVLLIMLIITIPIQLHAVSLDLPSGAPPRPLEPPAIVRVDIDAQGTVHWNGEALGDHPALEARMRVAASQPVQPEVHLRPDRRARYEVVAAVMASTQRIGLTKMGIVGSEQFTDLP